MTATAPVAITQARSRREARALMGPAHIRVEKGKLIEFCMNSKTLAHELMERNAEVIRRLAVCFPDTEERQHVLNATHAVHDKAVEALNEWLTATDRYESTEPIRR